MEEEIIIEETRPQPAYVLLTEADYVILNDAISAAKGYDLGKPTERYAHTVPSQAKINIKYDEAGNEISYDTICVMPITSEVQENYPALLEGIELVKNYVKLEQAE